MGCRERALKMKFGYRVVSLHLAKKLAEILPEDLRSMFVWEVESDSCYSVKYSPFALPVNNGGGVKIYQAYSSAELLDILPATIIVPERAPFEDYLLRIEKHNAKNIQYTTQYHCQSFQPPEMIEHVLLPQNTYDENIADCLAKLLLTLYENKFISFGLIK